MSIVKPRALQVLDRSNAPPITSPTTHVHSRGAGEDTRQLKQWPDSWKTDATDVAFGEELVRIFEEFLTELYLEGRSTRTINRHRGNLWVLGGELVRRRSTESFPCSWPAMRVLANYVSEDGGPFLLSRASEEEQATFDATCRKLFDFLPEVPGEQHAN